MTFTDAGQACCAPNGGACDSDAGYSGNFTCCSGTCVGFACTCDSPGDVCYDDQGCCSGGVCLPEYGVGQLACCVTLGQTCAGNEDCCTRNCQDLACACVPDGGACKSGAYNITALGPAACCSGECGDAGTCL